jgi:hypothetical protein
VCGIGGLQQNYASVPNLSAGAAEAMPIWRLAAQAIQLIWRTIKQLLAEDDQSVVDTALVHILHSRPIQGTVAVCLQLPLCAFATPKTWSGARLQFVPLLQHLVSESSMLAAWFHICDFVYSLERISTSAALACLQAGRGIWW